MRRAVSGIAVGIAFLITNVAFPALDGGSKDGAYLGAAAPASAHGPAADSKEPGYLD